MDELASVVTASDMHVSENSASHTPMNALPRLQTVFRTACLAIVVALVAPWSVSHAQGLRIAVSRTALSLPVFVAEQQGYFAAEGLQAKLDECIGGYRCLKKLLDGTADVATVGDLPIVLNSFERGDYAVIGTIATASDHVRLVAHARSGITTPGHLAGKRIGAVLGSASQYFLDVYLLTLGVDPRELSVIALQPEQMLQALQARKVDAVAIWDPFAYNAIKALGPNGLVLPNSSAYTSTFNLVAHRKLAGTPDAVLVKLLRAIERAERFIQERPDEAKAILRARLDVDQAFVDWAWQGLSYRLGIDQSLITLMESEARWAIREGHVTGRMPPDITTLLHTVPLKRVNPAAVRIER